MKTKQQAQEEVLKELSAFIAENSVIHVEDDVKKTFQIVLTTDNTNDFESAQETALELKQKFPGITVEIYETKKMI